MKPFAINAALPLLTERDDLKRRMMQARLVSTVEMHIVPGSTVTALSHAAQAIIQSMLDKVEADLLALGVDLS